MRPKQGRPLPKVLSRDEVERLIAAAGAQDGAAGLRLGCMVELLYASGLRVSELLGLTLEAVRRDPAYLIVKGKGGKERLAPAERRGARGGEGLSRPSATALPAQGRPGQPLAVPVARRRRPR